ncbi:MAG: hypothetical protein ACFHVJ_15900 [Aestuariibacter sp.]
MSTLKGKAKIEAIVSRMQSNTVSQFISEHVGSEVNFNSVRATLPQLLSRTSSLVKVNNRVSGDFFACSEQGLSLLVQEVLENKQATHSFFDDMDSFVTNEVIGISALDSIAPIAAEYSSEDVNSLLNLSEK